MIEQLKGTYVQSESAEMSKYIVDLYLVGGASNPNKLQGLDPTSCYGVSFTAELDCDDEHGFGGMTELTLDQLREIVNGKQEKDWLKLDEIGAEKNMKLNIEFNCEIKDVKRALAILDLPIGTDEEIIERFERGEPVDMIPLIDKKDQFSTVLAWVALMEAHKNAKEELPERAKSKFAQRLEEAQRIQQDRKK